MDWNGELVAIAKRLLSEDDEARAAEILLEHVLNAVGAQRGFIVLREGDSFEQKFHIRFDRGLLSKEAREFSRTLVRGALQSGELIHSANVASDPRFTGLESIEGLGSVLVAPLRCAGEVYGVVYLEHSRGPAIFGPEQQRFVNDFCELSGLFLRRDLERRALRERNQSLERDLFSRHNFAGIVTQDAAMLRLLETVAQVADSDATVLILGETGTGKELIARALHANSGRRQKPFVPVHCTALPGTLLESELFGHVKGAFTGADRDRAGRISSAAGGTLFLDEIAEIPLELQAKLLRFLQFGEVQRLGSDRLEKADVRVVAATHQDLERQIQLGRFRQDLYFRINVLELRIPSLRDRRGDIPVLLDHFLRRHWKRAEKGPHWSPAALRRLEGYSYPGNVRELEHLVERACLLARGPELDVGLLPEAIAGAPLAVTAESEFQSLTNDELTAARDASVAAIEKRFLTSLMSRTEGNISRASRESNIPRSYLQRLLARHGLRSG